MADLRKIPSRDELNKLIAEMEAMDLSGYTSRSVANFKAALNVAKAAAANPDATDEELATAYYNGKDAIDGLVKADSSKPNSSKGSYIGQYFQYLWRIRCCLSSTDGFYTEGLCGF